MNCFQFDYFCGYHTAEIVKIDTTSQLWIAFNLITFVDITQLFFLSLLLHLCCELLSIWLLLWISHSKIYNQLKEKYVVNCFQFDYFCGYHTARRQTISKMEALWIAFNLITFVDITQPSFCSALAGCCCELLSIWLLLWISHSSAVPETIPPPVVNCFQFDYFCGYHTAYSCYWCFLV